MICDQQVTQAPGCLLASSPTKQLPAPPLHHSRPQPSRLPPPGPSPPPCSWLPTFYHQVYGVDVAGSSAYSVLPFVVTVAATNAAGWIADGLVNNKVRWSTTMCQLASLHL